jgi:hypothetical protein
MHSFCFLVAITAEYQTQVLINAGQPSTTKPQPHLDLLWRLLSRLIFNLQALKMFYYIYISEDQTQGFTHARQSLYQ